MDVVGAGGLGGAFVWGAVKKGIGSLQIYDGDRVEISNLNRQFFTPRDLGRNKAVCLARNGARAGYMGTRLVAVPYFLQAAVDRGLDRPCDAVFCGVNNDETRVFVARRYQQKPVVFAAVGRDAGHGYVAVQEPGGSVSPASDPRPFKQKRPLAASMVGAPWTPQSSTCWAWWPCSHSTRSTRWSWLGRVTGTSNKWHCTGPSPTSVPKCPNAGIAPFARWQ